MPEERSCKLPMSGRARPTRLGVTTKTRGRDITNVVAMISSVVLLGLLKGWQDATGTVIIAFPWWVVLGTAWTHVVGICFRPLKR